MLADGPSPQDSDQVRQLHTDIWGPLLKSDSLKN